MLSAYYRLAKPGIVYGNLLPAVAAFLYASRFSFHPLALCALVLGLGAIIAAACVFNNYFDRGIDRAMARTRARPLAAGTIGTRAALGYGSALLGSGCAVLAPLGAMPLALALFGFVTYAFVYTFSKPKTHWATVIGSVPGSVPVTVGYAAASGGIDGTALLLFFILVLWQMPHFYAIALYRLEEYAAAGIPVLPLKRGARPTKRRIVAYILAFVAASAALTATGAEGYAYLVVMIAVGGAWFAKALCGFSAPDDAAWGRSVFLFSLIVLVTFCIALPLGIFLP